MFARAAPCQAARDRISPIRLSDTVAANAERIDRCQRMALLSPRIRVHPASTFERVVAPMIGEKIWKIWTSRR
jgi:hypothetical protein